MRFTYFIYWKIQLLFGFHFAYRKCVLDLSSYNLCELLGYGVYTSTTSLIETQSRATLKRFSDFGGEGDRCHIAQNIDFGGFECIFFCVVIFIQFLKCIFGKIKNHI